MNFIVHLLIFTSILYLCSSLRLNPLENNDKLQSIKNHYIAEWQWESWSMKQNVSDKDVSPGPRVNAALWKDNNRVNWYLFGGQPIDPQSEKIYSDIWRYSVASRSWERVFPFPQQTKGKHTGKIGGMVSLRVNFFDEYNSKHPPSHENKIILCGRSLKNANKMMTTTNVWSNFNRRKADDSTAMLNESKSLAVYGPRTSKSNTVWQIDLKDKLWTGYVCCCDTSNYDKMTPSQKETTFNADVGKDATDSTGLNTSSLVKKDETDINVTIDKVEDEVDNEQEHLTIGSNSNNGNYGFKKKKKINQNKKGDVIRYDNETKAESNLKIDSAPRKILSPEKYNLHNYSNNSGRVNASEILKNLSTENVLVSKNQSEISNIFKSNRGTKSIREPRNFPSGKKAATTEKPGVDYNFENPEIFIENGKSSSKLVSKYCPDFSDEGEPISWCDSGNDVLITADLSSPHLVLWFFNLKTSHWSQHPVQIADDTHWPKCSNSSSIRYAGAGEEVYIFCSMMESEEHSWENTTLNSTASSKNSSDGEHPVKLVYRINSRKCVLESLGKITMDRFFKMANHKEMWNNESHATLQVVRFDNRETIMLLAYNDLVDLWILMKGQSSGYRFEPVENIWRGSALKWFAKYNAAHYNFHFVTESNAAETLLMSNPRSVPYNEYWPRERGRFIVRILKNENIKNHTGANQEREYNLTYDLLQSDINLPNADDQFSRSYNVKVIVFFGISLAIFALFGIVLFLKKCVNCPSRMITENECHKSPPVIRYSVMHDDVLYPVA